MKLTFNYIQNEKRTMVYTDGIINSPLYHVISHIDFVGLKRYEDISMMAGDHIIPYSPIPSSGQLNGPTTPDNLQMLCHSCNLDKRNKPYDKDAEEKRLQDLYTLSDAAVAALPEANLN